EEAGCALAGCALNRAATPRNPIGSSRLTNCEQAPLVRDALQRVQPAILELEPGARGQVLDRARDQNLPRPGLRDDALPDMHGDAGQALLQDLDLPRVQAGADLDPERS